MQRTRWTPSPYSRCGCFTRRRSSWRWRGGPAAGRPHATSRATTGRRSRCWASAATTSPVCSISSACSTSRPHSSGSCCSCTRRSSCCSRRSGRVYALRGARCSRSSSATRGLPSFASDLRAARDSGAVLEGGALVFGSAFLYAIYLVRAGPVIARMGSTRFIAWAMLVSAVFVLAQFVLTRPLAALAVPLSIQLLVLAMAVFSTVLPTWLIAEAVRRIGANASSQIGSLGPVFTIFLGALLLDEPVRPSGRGAALSAGRRDARRTEAWGPSRRQRRPELAQSRDQPSPRASCTARSRSPAAASCSRLAPHCAAERGQRRRPSPSLRWRIGLARRARLNAVLTNPTCEKACGKLPASACRGRRIPRRAGRRRCAARAARTAHASCRP